MVDSACQTEDAGLGGGAWADLNEDPDIPAIPEVTSSPGGAEAFLNQIMKTQVTASVYLTRRAAVGIPHYFSFCLPQLSSQAELEMALRSQMEIIADSPRGVGTVHFGPVPPASGRSSSVSRVRSVEHLKPQACAAKPSRREDAPHDEGSGSDGECHGEDDEVRSLSLSEDGPVIRRSVSQGSTARVAATALNMIAKRGAAPDPIAMLTDGTRKASSRATAGDYRASADMRWSGDGWLVGEQLSGEVSCVESAGSPSHVMDGAAGGNATAAIITDITDRTGSADGEALGSAAGSLQNESDHSMAPTARANGVGSNPVHMAGAAVDFKGLLPVLSKVTGHNAGVLSPQEKEHLCSQEKLLEVVQDGPGVAALAQANRARPLNQRVRTPVRPSARRGSDNVQALDLSQVTRLPPLDHGPCAVSEASEVVRSARSDVSFGSHVSFGSQHSAFTCWSTSSPSSSHLASPHAMPLKTTVSMPALTPR